MLQPIFSGRDAEALLEDLAKVAAAVKAGAKGDLGDGVCCLSQSESGFFQPIGANEVGKAAVKRFFEQPTKIAVVKVERVGGGMGGDGFGKIGGKKCHRLLAEVSAVVVTESFFQAALLFQQTEQYRHLSHRLQLPARRVAHAGKISGLDTSGKRRGIRLIGGDQAGARQRMVLQLLFEDLIAQQLQIEADTKVGGKRIL